MTIVMATTKSPNMEVSIEWDKPGVLYVRVCEKRGSDWHLVHESLPYLNDKQKKAERTYKRYIKKYIDKGRKDMSKIWYAVCMNRYDNDLGTGSFDFEEAMKMAKEMDASEIVIVDDDEAVEIIDLLDDYIKYFLSNDPFDDDKFYLSTKDENTTVHIGRYSEVGKWVDIKEGDGWTDILDEYFELRLGIKSEEWMVG